MQIGVKPDEIKLKTPSGGWNKLPGLPGLPGFPGSWFGVWFRCPVAHLIQFVNLQIRKTICQRGSLSAMWFLRGGAVRFGGDNCNLLLLYVCALKKIYIVWNKPYTLFVVTWRINSGTQIFSLSISKGYPMDEHTWGSFSNLFSRLICDYFQCILWELVVEKFSYFNNCDTFRLISVYFIFFNERDWRQQ